jgi:hypothetical protein
MRQRGGPAFWSVAALVLLALASAMAGCRRSSSSRTAPSASAKALLSPLASQSWILPLAAPGFAAAQLALPLGARSPRPLLVALHGDDDRPEWLCGSYHHIVRSRAFVLCPTGFARGDRFTLGSTLVTKNELRALLPALKARYGPYLAKGSVVLAALGPSVPQALEIALEEPSFFSRLVLIDGSLERLTLGVVQRFASAGGKSVLVVCSAGSPCRAGAAEHLRSLERAGVETRLLAPEKGSGLDGEITALLTNEWPWFVRQEPRWQ